MSGPSVAITPPTSGMVSVLQTVDNRLLLEIIERYLSMAPLKSSANY
ncbi:hypothetical protein [Pseudomonas sp. F8002]|nr:hypothetical protein [Pseudomonas sp. F8002]